MEATVPCWGPVAHAASAAVESRSGEGLDLTSFHTQAPAWRMGRVPVAAVIRTTVFLTGPTLS